MKKKRKKKMKKKKKNKGVAINKQVQMPRGRRASRKKK